MKARCPNNKDHKEFITVAHVMQDWKVDEHGEFIAVVEECSQVSFKPDSGNIWTCAICGAEAIVESN
jgi:hypothetical protein